MRSAFKKCASRIVHHLCDSLQTGQSTGLLRLVPPGDLYWPTVENRVQKVSLFVFVCVCVCLSVCVCVNIYIYMVKISRYRPGVTQRVGRGIALLFHDRGTRRG